MNGATQTLDLDDRETALLCGWVRTHAWLGGPAAEMLEIHLEGPPAAPHTASGAATGGKADGGSVRLRLNVRGGLVNATLSINTTTWLPDSVKRGYQEGGPKGRGGEREAEGGGVRPGDANALFQQLFSFLNAGARREGRGALRGGGEDAPSSLAAFFCGLRKGASEPSPAPMPRLVRRLPLAEDYNGTVPFPSPCAPSLHTPRRWR